MKAAGTSRQWVTAEEVELMRETIRQQKGQLALALSVLLSLGFELDYFLGAA